MKKKVSVPFGRSHVGFCLFQTAGIVLGPLNLLDPVLQILNQQSIANLFFIKTPPVVRPILWF